MEKETPEEYVARVEKELNPKGEEIEVSFPEHEKWKKNVAQLKEEKEAFKKKQEERLKGGIEEAIENEGESDKKEAQG